MVSGTRLLVAHVFGVAIASTFEWVTRRTRLGGGLRGERNSTAVYAKPRLCYSAFLRLRTIPVEPRGGLPG